MSSAPASQPATPNPEKESELIYGLESHPPFGSSLLAALQHILAMVLSVMAPPAIVAGALGVPPGGHRLPCQHVPAVRGHRDLVSGVPALWYRFRHVEHPGHELRVSRARSLRWGPSS